ncbi:TetR/AcrR family transcriptional regulator [Mycobacterium avium subsp. hominissuis]|uniref:Putative transcriptional regulator n=2 Tax=Mycobacterium avium TaxID=1764 RepID=A0A0H2ZZ07_MYCA1|nr:putative transcriptional regulator [Mycobacterium avium 104]KDO99664.1 TetR family transcriptional regulator [Mycobacterium avium subsp. hominissuis 101]
MPTKVPFMGNGASRSAYFEKGLEILSEVGYGGLKLAEVCLRVGVSTGSFYHFFDNWPKYTRELIEHWQQTNTIRLAEWIEAEPDPRRRIDRIIDIGLNLPHGAEAAIRAWSSTDPEVYAVQKEVDQERHRILRDSAVQILHDDRQAQLFADWAVYLLVGYEQATLPPDKEALQWIVGQLLDALDAGRFASAPLKKG